MLNHQINVYYSFILKNVQSPLHKASSSGHVDVVINLVANGAQIGSLDLVRFYQYVLNRLTLQEYKLY